jgi:hypothetical protein
MIDRSIERIIFGAALPKIRAAGYPTTTTTGHRRLGAEMVSVWPGGACFVISVIGYARARGSECAEILRLLVCARGTHYEVTFARSEAPAIGAWLASFVITLDANPLDRPRVELPVPEYYPVAWGPEYRWTMAANKAYRNMKQRERALS